MMKPRISYIKYVVLAILTWVVISCGGVDKEPVPSSTPEAASNFKVAILIPDPINETAWSQSGYAGLKLIETQLKSQVAYTDKTDAKTDAEVKNIFRQYAKEGFNFIIGHGGQYLPAAEAVAKEFPRIKFAVVNYPNAGNNSNFGSLSFRDGEVGYLTGVVAALKTNTNKVSFIGGVDYPSLKEVATLFERGAKSIKPDISVTIEWVGNWQDTAKAQKIAESQIKSGVDIISVRADPASLGVHQLAKNKRVYTIGWIEDQYQKAPGTVLTSAMQSVPELLLQGATLVRQGRWEGKQYKLGLREKVQDLAPFRNSLTVEQEAVVNKVKEDILTGKIDVSL